jgi:hypothetical protein
MSRLGNTNDTLIRHDYKRACYRALLSELPIEEVKAFFSRVPLIIDGVAIEGKDLFTLLWTEKAKVPLCYDFALDNELEPFFIERGADVGAVMRRVLWLNNQSTYIPGKVLLTWFYPRLESLFDSLDTRDMIFPLISLFCENYLPGHICRRVKKWEDGEWIKSVQVYITDTTFAERMDWDYEFIGGPQIMNGPVMFGMPPFERFTMLADTRPPERIIWEAADGPTVDAGKVYIGGRVVGEVAGFHAFLDKHGIDLSRFSPPDLPVALMSKDYFCPVRKRVVLHEGCAYGAPVYLNLVEHRRLAGQARNGVLSNLIADIAREDVLNEDALAAKHQQLLDSLSGVSVFEWHPADESVTLNGVHFTKGIPARIMKSLLEAYVREGKREFEYREFKRKMEISLGQKNSNFEVRFYRIMEKLKAESQGVRIEKTGRGRFRLSVHGTFKYLERA